MVGSYSCVGAILVQLCKISVYIITLLVMMMDMTIDYIHTAKTIYNMCCSGVANCYLYDNSSCQKVKR